MRVQNEVVFGCRPSAGFDRGRSVASGTSITFFLALALALALSLGGCGGGAGNESLDLLEGGPVWTGNALLKVEGEHLAFCLDSDRDESGLDGLTDVSILCGGLGLPPALEGGGVQKLDSAEIVLDARSGILVLSHRGAPLLSIQVGKPAEPSETVANGTMARAISYRINDTREPLEKSLAALLESEGALGGAPSTECPAGGEGSGKCECLGAFGRTGAVCSEEFSACCRCSDPEMSFCFK